MQILTMFDSKITIRSQQQQLSLMLREDNILQRTLTEESNRVKYHHLLTENSSLHQTIKDLQAQVGSLRMVNSQLLKKTPQSILLLVNELSQQNQNLESTLFKLTRNNEQLSCAILMKSQLMCEAQRQYRQIITNLQDKIYQLRISIQSKEATVSAIEQKVLQQKQQQYGSSTRVNMMYFNEMNELKGLIDRTSLQNAQLRFLNAMKQEEVQKLKLELKKCEIVLQNKEEWKKEKEQIGFAMNQQTKAKGQKAKNKLEEELTRYDMKYKYLSSPSKNNTTPNQQSQLNNLKLFLTSIIKQNRNYKAENERLKKSIEIQQKQHKMLQNAYKKLNSELVISKIQVQFYKNNFKQLCRVPAERKIKYFDEFYEEIISNLQKRLHERQCIINYFKHWQKVSQPIIEKCIMGASKKRIRKMKQRSNSCTARYNYIQQSPKRPICQDKQKQQAIFSFINQTHNVDLMVNFTVDTSVQLQGQLDFFKDDISVISKPKAIEEKHQLAFTKKKQRQRME